MQSKNLSVLALAVLAAASLMTSAAALAEEWPFVPGDYWDVTGIDVKDGGSWAYANWLATEWRKDLEFAKSKGWIKDYMVFSNSYARKGEPDLYLVSIRESIPSGAESEKRQQEYLAWQSKSIETMVKESGNRVEYREVGSDFLLQHMKFRD
jgi:hypothetical protein